MSSDLDDYRARYGPALTAADDTARRELSADETHFRRANGRLLRRHAPDTDIGPANCRADGQGWPCATARDAIDQLAPRRA